MLAVSEVGRCFPRVCPHPVAAVIDKPFHMPAADVQAVSEVARRQAKGLPLLDAEVDMKVDDSAYRKAQRRAEALEGMLERHPLHKHPELPGRLQQLAEKQVGWNAMHCMACLGCTSWLRCSMTC